MEFLKFKKLQIITDVLLKGIIILIIVLESIVLLPSITSRIKSQLEEGAFIAEFSILGNSIKILNDVNTETRLSGNEDSNPPELVARITERFNANKETWAFVGTYQDGIWSTSYFDVKEIPQPGNVLTAIGDINRRTDKPRLIGDKWRMGEIEGLIKNGDKMQVTEVNKVKHKMGYLVVWVKGIVIK